MTGGEERVERGGERPGSASVWPLLSEPYSSYDRQDPPTPHIWPWVWISSLTGLHFIWSALSSSVPSQAPRNASFVSGSGRNQ